MRLPDQKMMKAAFLLEPDTAMTSLPDSSSTFAPPTGSRLPLSPSHILEVPMSYAAAIDQLNAMAPELFTNPGQPRRKFSLDQIRILLDALGNPQNRFPSVLIAGTNGKGSTAATLASILTESGLKTGLYTSPHLERVNERIRVARTPIAQDDFSSIFFKVLHPPHHLAHAC